MTSFETLIDFGPLHALVGHPLAEKLGWVLLHFLWEGTLLAGVLAVVLVLMRRRPAAERYAAGLAALGLMVMLPVATWVALAPAPQAGTEALSGRAGRAGAERRAIVAPDGLGQPGFSGLRLPKMRTERIASSDRGRLGAVGAWVRRYAEQSAPLLALGWAVGVLLLALRTVGGWGYVRQMRREATPAGAPWRASFARLAREMGVSGAPVLGVSERASGPAAMGWWRPAVLVPVGFLSGLPANQVEAILRHELAHLRRHDYLVGLGQAVVETMLFYHPAVWWVSGRVRILREHCCDDLAVQAGAADRVGYARALAALSDWRSPAALAPAATDGSLLDRIRRVTGQPARGADALGWPAALAALTALLVLGACAAGGVAGADEAKPPQEPDVPAVSGASPDASSRPRVRIYTADGDTVIADTLKAGPFFSRGEVVDSGGVRSFGRMAGGAVRIFGDSVFVRSFRQRGFENHRLDSLVTLSRRRADSVLANADSLFAPLRIRLDSLREAHVFKSDSIRLHGKALADSFRIMAPMRPDSLPGLSVWSAGAVERQEAAQMREEEEAERVREEIVRARRQAAEAREEAAQARQEAARAREEAAQARREAARAREEEAIQRRREKAAERDSTRPHLEGP